MQNIPIFDNECCSLYLEALETINKKDSFSFYKLGNKSGFFHVSELIEFVKKIYEHSDSLDDTTECCEQNESLKLTDSSHRTFKFKNDECQLELDAEIFPHCGYRAVYKSETGNKQIDVIQDSISASTAASSEDVCYPSKENNREEIVISAEELWYIYVTRCEDLFIFPEDILSCMDFSCMSSKMKKKYMLNPKYGVKLNYGDMYTIGSMPFGGHRLADPRTVELDRFGRMLNSQWHKYARPYINRESNEVSYYG